MHVNPQPSRRKLLRLAAETGFRGLAWATAPDLLRAQQQAPAKPPDTSLPSISPEDDAFLEDLEKSNFQFFWEQADPQTGLVKDRCHVRSEDNSVVASIAATGFGLTALCIGQQRGYVSFQDARNRVLTTMRFLWKSMFTHRGFYYHFANMKTASGSGTRRSPPSIRPCCCVSSYLPRTFPAFGNQSAGYPNCESRGMDAATCLSRTRGTVC